MKYAISPRGVGNPTGYRMVGDDDPLSGNETFFVTDDPEGKVLAANQSSLRDEILADRTPRRAAQATEHIDSLFSPDSEEDVSRALLRELIIDLAETKGQTIAQYRAQIRLRIIARS
jgi:hypothetical protein